MMAMPQQFAHPGGMPGHAGMPPGAHAMPHPGAQGMQVQPGMMGQQMHPGMGGPGMSQGPIMNIGQMPTGMGGPNAHAMSHLGPGSMQQFQHQQQMQTFQSPQLIAQQQQQIQAQQSAHVQARQQQLMQQHMAAQQGQGMGMTPQQQQMLMQQRMAASGAMGGIPPHLVGMQGRNHQQQFMAAQAQNQMLQMQQQQAQQQQAQAHQAQAHAQQQQLQQQQQAQAAQQAASQSAAAPGQPAVQQPMRPPSTMAGGPENSVTVALAQQHAAQQAQQNHAQSQSSQASAHQATPQPQNAGTPQPQSTPQQAQAQPQSQTPQQGNQPGQQGPQDAAKNAQLQAGQRVMPNMTQIQMQQRIQMDQRAAQQQQALQAANKQYALKLYQFTSELNGASTDKHDTDGRANSLDFWKAFVKKFFSEQAILRQDLMHAKRDTSKQFELHYAVIARFYWTQFVSRLKNIQLSIERLAEGQLADGGHFISCDRASFSHYYINGQQVVMHGKLRVDFNREGKFDLFEFSCQEWNEYVTLKSIPESPDLKASPTLTKKGQKGQAQQKKISLGPKPTVGDYGVTDALIAFFEMTETMNHMSPLFDFVQSNANLSPNEALQQLVQTRQSHKMQSGQFNPAMQSGAATPNAQFNGSGQFNSPAGAHLGLPNTASPASMNMSPAMQQHGLQQNAGGSSGASANTSPNVTNKRRRASQVKMEIDQESNSEPKVKQSPRVGKRVKPGT